MLAIAVAIGFYRSICSNAIREKKSDRWVKEPDLGRDPYKLEQVLAACPGLEFVIDAPLRPINRPKDKEKPDKHYSGKKKTTMVKNKDACKCRSLSNTLGM